MGAGSVAYSKGKLESKEAASVPHVQKATVNALAQLKLPVFNERGDAATARVESRYSDGTPVTIDLESKGTSVTQVSIRVGTFGDQGRSQQLLSAINRNLPANKTASNERL